jgi:hypothetical protein
MAAQRFERVLVAIFSILSNAAHSVYGFDDLSQNRFVFGSEGI